MHVIQSSARVIAENMLNIAVTLVATFVLAAFMYETIEKPMEKFKQLG